MQIDPAHLRLSEYKNILVKNSNIIITISKNKIFFFKFFICVYFFTVIEKL